MGHAESVGIELPRPPNDPVGATADIGGGFALGHAIVPDRPAGPEFPDLRGGQPFVGAVVPLDEVGIRLPDEPGQGTGLLGRAPAGW